MDLNKTFDSRLREINKQLIIQIKNRCLELNMSIEKLLSEIGFNNRSKDLFMKNSYTLNMSELLMFEDKLKIRLATKLFGMSPIGLFNLKLLTPNYDLYQSILRLNTIKNKFPFIDIDVLFEQVGDDIITTAMVNIESFPDGITLEDIETYWDIIPAIETINYEFYTGFCVVLFKVNNKVDGEDFDESDVIAKFSLEEYYPAAQHSLTI